MLNPKALGCALSVLAGGFWFLVMTFSLLADYWMRPITTLGPLHPFFSFTWMGMVIIVIEHLIGGFIVGWLFAKVYNKFARSN
ncbi:MAG: hypothetical protein NTW60_00095 [Candidatus Wolfebacteria bacterium]|nr:hypothetical protein [Candidatus Wolfebacteria bacterium]